MVLQRAKSVITAELEAISQLKKRLGSEFVDAVDMLAKCKGRVIVCGMGKTGLIGRKIAATLSSTGTPSFWLHSAEALHGDLGQVTKIDVMILISHSGETDETKSLLPLLKKIGIKSIAITGNPRSSLGRYCDIVLNVAVKKEGCPLGLAPMASTTATLVIGDALAACLIDKKNFRREDFAFYHPGGSLGRNLLLRVADIMRTGSQYAKVKPSSSVKDVLFAITKARCGSACVIDSKGKLVGIFTDGDLRRHLKNGSLFLQQKVEMVMTKDPATIAQDHLAAEAMCLLQQRRIDEVPVVDEKGRSVGLLDVQDLLKAGIV
ncbi:MAG TPA: KpsF/GutQ family sugar-phosphate isomerase [Candidatus Omnitrophota bacterium]|nr:KpsF/GutQ family sugar-phosphate isomerase [Candidatus Omnitrophota bacterium]HQL42018.1 KpsF/GutQ family sugar-phosphate isomerase [Candidatus Omnitrophota bacterium]